MKITNMLGLDQSFVDYCTLGIRPLNPERMGVTTLIGPPQIRALKFKHWDEMEEDIADRLWAMFGTGFHEELAKYRRVGVVQEFKMEMKAGPFTLVGVADIIDFVMKYIDDYKVTSVWSVKFGNHPEWDQQLNVYRIMLWKLTGVMVSKLRIHAIMRDWSARDAESDKSYPQVQIRTHECDVWDTDKAIEYMKNCINEHSASTPRPCTPEEMWAKPSKWAVMKKGNKSACRGGVKDTEEQAKKYISDERLTAKDDKAKKEVAKMYIEHRPGECLRCKRYCGVAKFCLQNPHREDK